MESTRSDLGSDDDIDNRGTFPFLSLPLELRESIYSLIISGKTVHIRKYHRNPHHCYGILTTCKQTYRETLKIFYSTSIFAIEEQWARKGVEWLAALPDEYRSWITRVVFLRDLRSFGNMYSKIAYRASSVEKQQAMLLEPFLKELQEREIVLRKGVLRA